MEEEEPEIEERNSDTQLQRHADFVGLHVTLLLELLRRICARIPVVVVFFFFSFFPLFLLINVIFSLLILPLEPSGSKIGIVLKELLVYPLLDFPFFPLLFSSLPLLIFHLCKKRTCKGERQEKGKNTLHSSLTISSVIRYNFFS